MSLIDDLKRMQEQVSALPKPLAYIVLDHAMRRADTVTECDGHGKKYLRVPPSIMDALMHPKAMDAAPGVLAASLTGVPVYRREDMPEGWPYTARIAPHRPSTTDHRKGPRDE